MSHSQHAWPDEPHPKLHQVIDQIEQVIIGKREVVELALTAVLARGHILLEDVPGVGKTMLVRALARALNCTFKRIQFTPDLLPSDVTGVSIFNQKTAQFEFRPGPIFAHILLADEINRTSPKTQSALLEAMEEGNVTVDGDTRALPAPFLVLATQNPVEYEGTYPLPEAQLDRFLFKLSLGYPTLEEELEILNRHKGGDPIAQVRPVLSADKLIQLQKEVEDVYIERSVAEYMVHLVRATRTHPHVYLGASPRGSLALMQASQAFAFVRGRKYVIPDDVKYLAPYVLQHRLMLTSESRLSGSDVQQVMKEVLHRVAVPVQ